MTNNLKIAIVGGTGFDSIEGFNGKPAEITTPYDKVWDPVDGEFVTKSVDVEIGTIEGANGVEVLLVKRHGAGHSVPASQVNHRANAYAAFHWGADFAVGITAVGILSEKVNVGDFVVLDRMFRQDLASSELDYYGRHATVHMEMRHPFDKDISGLILGACELEFDIEFDQRSLDVPYSGCVRYSNTSSEGHSVTLHNNGGVALINKNNSFSTPEESAFYREKGLTVVGMTAYETLPFALLGVPYGSLALLVDDDNLVREEGKNQVTQATVDNNIGLFRGRVGKIINQIARSRINKSGIPDRNSDIELYAAKQKAMIRLGNSVIGGRVRDSLRDRDERLFYNLEKAIRLAEESRSK